MGYYVEIKRSNFKIPAKNLNDAYERMCNLNFTVPNSEKRGRGGSYPKNTQIHIGPDKCSWFSWMDWNYHEIYEDAGEILDALGFSFEYDEEGNLYITGYYDKTGQEDLFLESISSISEGSIIWVGEDDTIWLQKYGGDKVIVVKKDLVELFDVVISQ